MARAKKIEAPELDKAHELTAGLIERLTCPVGKTQVFLRDTKAPGLRVRVTPASAKRIKATPEGVTPEHLKVFVFEAKLNRQTIRRTIGDVRVWDIDAARTEARRLAVVVRSDKQNPFEIERQQAAAQAAEIAAAAAKVESDRVEAAAVIEAAKVAALTVGEAWASYVEERRPRWGELHYKDHIKLARAGGVPAKRGTDGRGVTIDMPLYALMALPLRELTAPVIEAWAAKEAQTRATSARLAWRLLKVFLGWCGENPRYADLIPAKNPAKTTKARESLGKAGEKFDVLQRGQLAAWFAAVQQIQNPVIAAALQVMLLTGARPGEVLGLRWDDMNTKWKGLTIRDKVEGTRIIPLTPYVAHLMAGLPRRNALIFSSATAEAGALTAPRKHHVNACAVAGIDGLSLHGLRRSFKSLTEWLEIPAGVVAQLMGHKPSATAEKHYTVRPLELLAIHHEKIEAWILEQAGIVFDAKAAPGALRVVAG